MCTLLVCVAPLAPLLAPLPYLLSCLFAPPPPCLQVLICPLAHPPAWCEEEEEEKEEEEEEEEEENGERGQLKPFGATSESSPPPVSPLSLFLSSAFVKRSGGQPRHCHHHRGQGYDAC